MHFALIINISWSKYFLDYKSDTITGYTGISLAVLGWGLSNSLIVYGLSYINPYLFLTVRFIVAALVFVPFILLFKRKAFIKLVTNKWTWIIAFFEFIGLELQYIGQQTISAGLSTLIIIQYIIFVPILSAKFLHTPITKMNVLSIIIAITGSILITTDGKIMNLISNINTGVFFLLLSALAYSFYIITSSYFTNKSDKQIDSSAMFFIVILGLGLFSIIPTSAMSHSFIVPKNIWIVILILVVFSTIIPFIGYFKGLKVISANTMSFVLLLQLVVPTIIDIVFLGITYSLWVIIGSFLIVSSLLLFVSKPILDKLQLEPESINESIQMSKS